MYGGINIMEPEKVQLEELAVIRVPGLPTCLVEKEQPGIEMR